ncbi:MAG: glycosyltransferase family 2 protein [Desulfobulbaceae bacterium]|nr:glycosyltransferase family 2 protein [Desulfobulbaceae bacterium]
MTPNTDKKKRQCLSVAIITYNEQERIGNTLKSVMFADEIVVVDSGSTDDTCAIARSFGARILFQEMRGFGAQKQHAVDRCTHDWVFIVDADEVIPNETAVEIQDVLLNPTGHAYRLSRKNFFHDKEIKHGSWGKDSVVRLFDKRKCHVSERQVHEQVVVNGLTLSLVYPIHHFPRRNLATFLEKANRYSSLGAIVSSSRKVSMAESFGHGVWTFVFNYIIRLGFLDGSEGFLIAFGDMVETFFKYAKRWELQYKSVPCDSPAGSQ